MAIVKNKKVNKGLEKKVFRELLSEFKKVNSPESIEKFFDKFMTASEKTIFVRRFTVINLLEQKKKYRDIKELLNISGNTISNIRDILSGRGYGRNPNRKGKYSESRTTKKKSKKFKRKYKGAANIIDLL